MLNSMVEKFKNKKGRENIQAINKASKRYFPVKTILKLSLILLMLSSCTPNRTETEMVLDSNKSVQTKTQVESQKQKVAQTQVEPDIQAELGIKIMPEIQVGPEIEVEPQEKITYSEEEIAKGLSRVKNLVNYYENTTKLIDGKDIKKTKEELDESKYIINFFSNLESNTYGGFAGGFNFLKVKFLDFSLFYINGEFCDCSKDNKSLIKDFKQGVINTVEKIESLQSVTTEDGERKSQEKLELDNLTANFFKDYIITDEDIVYFYKEAYNTNYRTTLEKSEDKKMIEKVARNLSFLTSVANEKIEEISFIDDGTLYISINNSDLLFDIKVKDLTEKMQSKSDKTTAEEKGDVAQL
ncbi:MAG: hypothetical protein EOM55_03745 [Clostridia bacterium]|nr:hypothetical protein [Clostridia bacterium]